MKKKISLTLLFIMIISLFMIENKVYASEKYDSDSQLFYEEKNGTIEIVRCYDYDPRKTITIPSKINGKNVTSIGDGAFYFCQSIENIIIPNSVVSIGDNAFCWCIQLKSIIIPSSVTSIGESAFDTCYVLKEIKVDKNNTKYSSNGGILYSKDQKILIRCPEGKSGNIIIPNGVTTIEDNAFFNCVNVYGGIKNIKLPSSVTSIGKSAFSGCALTNITIPNSVIDIGEKAFYYCTSLTSVTLPSSVTSIGDYAFCYCNKLTKITICNSTTTIGNMAIDTNATIYGYKTSTAENYANTNGNTFVELLKDDVTKNDWFYDAVKYVYDKNMIKGTDATHFSPYTKLSRAMLVTILWRMEGTPKATTNKFSDIKTTDWYYNAVSWAASKGIVNGYTNGKFGPNDNITRQQLCAILMNYARYKGKKVTARTDLSKYTDEIKIDSSFKNAVSWCVANKIISGKNSGTRIDPKGTATRAEAAAMLRTYCLNIK